METKLDKLRAQRKVKSDALTALIDARAAAEDQNFTEEQRTQFDTLEREITAIDGQIEEEQRIQRAMERERAARAFAGTSTTTASKDEQDVAKRFRLSRAFEQIATRGHVFEGPELEMHQEAVREANASGVSVSGFGMPSSMVRLQGYKKRALSVTGDPEDGSHLVPTDYQGIIPPLRPKLKVLDLGATTMTGLVGNLEMSRWKTLLDADWKGEIAAAVEGSAETDSFTLSPKRLTRKTQVSRRLLIQSPDAVEMQIRQHLEFAIAAALDAGAINGSGQNDQPKGILQFANRGSVPIGATGGAPTRNHFIALQKEIDTVNAPDDSLAYLSNFDVKAKILSTKLDDGSGKFLYENEGLLGRPIEFSSQVPNDLTKSTGSDLSAIIYGNWKSLIIGQWSGVDIIVDPYSLKNTAQLEMTVHGWYDIQAYYEQAFAAIVDAVTTLS